MRFLVFFLFFFGYFSTSALATPVVRYFSLTDARTGKAIKGYTHLTRNTILPANKFKGRLIGIKVVTRPLKVGSVKVRYLGRTMVLNKQPYQISQTASKFRLQLGRYLISARPFLKKGGKGKRGRVKQIILTVQVRNKKDDNDSEDNNDDDNNLDVIPTPTVPYVDDGEPLKVWANDGGDKVAKEERRAILAGANAVLNSTWDGKQISLFGARNETVSFNLVLEAAERDFHNVTVKVKNFKDSAGFEITSTDNYDPFNYIGRNIEIFKVRYLQIKGLSMLGYDIYDERHIPARFRRPYNNYGVGEGTFKDRADHDLSYPDIAVPQEIAEQCNIDQNTNQSFWVDLYIPKESPAGKYSSELEIYENGSLLRTLPISLEVLDFSLPDIPTAKTMLYFGYSDIARRYIAGDYWSSEGQKQLQQIRDRHFQMAHRHKISLIDDATSAKARKPNAEWVPRITGELFTAEAGYAGVGEGVGNGVYSIGTYGDWNWGNEMQSFADEWVKWFETHAADTDYFLYLADESRDYTTLNAWAKTLNDSTGRKLKSFATIPVSLAYKNVPELDIAASTGGIGTPSDWQEGARYFSETPGKELYFYNGHRPQSGSFMTDDDGIALRQVAWTQYKMKIKRWFYWESTYYNNFQARAGETNVFKRAQTFGYNQGYNEILGETGGNYSNGDGVLFYPGTDRIYPGESYEVEGPLASLRLKHWRRGIQDVDYLVLAAKKDPERVKQIVQRMIPKVLWEYGVDDPNDPTWVRTDISWSTDPDRWEAARRELANIILN